MPRLSVVIPVYNVEEFLEPCLDSLLAQTFTDFEAVMVDDGSTDRSAEIAQRYVALDERFKLVSQPNGGLSSARNTGTDHASGDLLVFLDSDDMLTENAYELLVGALDRTGSDFATGNVYRLTKWATVQSPFLARAFSETRLKTHVTKYRPLLADRPAWNKVWRRSFWDKHGFRFPEGRTYEDTPVTIPAHFLAKSVDVIAEPCYLWRIREGGARSITQRKTDPQSLIDRLTSIREVSEHLAKDGPRRSKRWYDESVVADDLRYYVNSLDLADDEYRALFLEQVNAFLDGTSDRIFTPLPAIERLKWHFVRRRLLPELLEVVRFQKEELYRTPPLRIRGRWYGDYPFRTDRRLKVPQSVYRLKSEFSMGAGLQDLRAADGRVVIRGHAYVNGIDAGSEDAQRVTVSLLKPGRLTRVRLIASALRLPTRSTYRPEVTGNVRGALSDLSWSGFEATLDPGQLRGEGRWEVYVTVRAAGIKRRRSRFFREPARPLQPLSLAAGDATVTVAVNSDAELDVMRFAAAAALRGARLLESGQVELEIDGPGDGLELREAGGRRFRVPIKDGRARVLAERLRMEEDSLWDLLVADGERLLPLTTDTQAAWEAGEGREVALLRAGHGAALAERAPQAVIDELRWVGEGELEVAGTAAGATTVSLARGADHGFSYDFPAERDGDRFRARLRPLRLQSLAGVLPINEGTWELRVDGVRATLAPPLHDRIPLATDVGHKRLEVGMTPCGRAVLEAGRDLDDDERGLYHQQRLQGTVYAPARRAPLRDAVVYSSFIGRQYSDSPRAIHEELVRRAAPLEHLWIVRDGRCAVPDTATVLREGSRAYHEALATARYVVSNDHFPDWVERRDDQLFLQTWHGTPFKKLGFDVSDMRGTTRKFQRNWDRQLRNWQYVLSPNRFSTPILRRAYLIEGEMLETGYPRVDVLARPDRDELSRALRARLGIPDGARTVLYAPTFRDHVQDRRNRYRLELALDLERLREAVGEDTVILFRKHHYIVDPVPETADGFVRDVSAYPDGTELMLAADVLMTDYSSMMVDFANTGRPMLFFTYDLDAYEDEIRGFYVDDFVGTVPGPLLRTTDEVAEALNGLDEVRAGYAERYAAFRETFCELDDGRAAARVVDRLF
jgi:CDP-glycerol glycerophosphotransferase